MKTLFCDHIDLQLSAGLYAFSIFHSSLLSFTTKKRFKFYLLLTGKLDVDNVELCLVSQFHVRCSLAINDLRLSSVAVNCFLVNNEPSPVVQV